MNPAYQAEELDRYFADLRPRALITGWNRLASTPCGDLAWYIISQLAYWREQLHDPLPVMKLGIPRRKRPIDGFRTARREVVLPARLSEAAKTLRP